MGVKRLSGEKQFSKETAESYLYSKFQHKPAGAELVTSFVVLVQHSVMLSGSFQ